LNTKNGQLMNTADASAYLGVRPQLLAQWRHEDRGPAFHLLGRLIRYARSDLDAWLKSVKIAPHR
jgi:uncharacterized protein Usg